LGRASLRQQPSLSCSVISLTSGIEPRVTEGASRLPVRCQCDFRQGSGLV